MEQAKLNELANYGTHFSAAHAAAWGGCAKKRQLNNLFRKSEKDLNVQHC